ncbi:putative ABC transporter ATP-binding protein [Streptomyces sp. RB5]|uniref:Putative ABC transporter ATP-binding protein n=1 Tax=Streptomyces smaragdinus TaxID=2585196 RepID=A0A7K0CR43_9ACTN|nr:ATP-binding cassette domain-containing protein [Streptomyces smaragdinus]MQY15958.1 putative ABC transporter ATP-binding protein [Streptomyces smaragdinus]
MAPPDNDVLFSRSLHYSYGTTPALAGVSLGVGEGEVLAVDGPRGSGKTTLLRCLSGQLKPEQGEVWFNSGAVHTLSAARRERLRLTRFGWIDTRPELVPELRAWENAALPLLLAGESHRRARKAAGEWLDRLDAGDLMKARPRSLTPAQAQRVAIARALVHEPAVVFADEPTAALHTMEGAQVLRTLIAACRSHGVTTVVASHLHQAVDLADRVVTLVDGRVRGTAVRTPRPTAEDSCSLSV